MLIPADHGPPLEAGSGDGFKIELESPSYRQADIPVALTGQRLRHSWPHLFGRHRSSTTTAIRLGRPDILLVSLKSAGPCEGSGSRTRTVPPPSAVCSSPGSDQFGAFERRIGDRDGRRCRGFLYGREETGGGEGGIGLVADSLVRCLGGQVQVRASSGLLATPAAVASASKVMT